MKTSLSLGLCMMFAGAVSGFGQVPAAAPHPHSFSLNVEPISTGGSSIVSSGSKNSSSTSTTSFRTTKTEIDSQRESVQVSVRNFGPLPDTAQVEWYFVSAPAKPDMTIPLADQQSIFDKGSKSVTIAPGGTQSFPVTSAEITSEIKRSAKLKKGKGKNGEVDETGSVLGGWMVRVVADGKTLDSRASKDKLADIIKDDAQLGKMKGH